MFMWVVAPHVSAVLYWAVVLLEFVVCCTVLADLTVKTLCHCVGNVICYCMYRYLFTGETKVYYCQIFTGIMAAYCLPNLVCIYLTDGPRMHPVVFWHYTVAVYCFSAVRSCFLLCTVIVHCKTFVTLFIVFLVYLSLLFDKHTVVFTLCAHGGFFTHSVLLSQMYITTVCVSPCLAGKGAVILSWGGSVFAARLVRYWLGLGGMGSGTFTLVWSHSWNNADFAIPS